MNLSKICYLFIAVFAIISSSNTVHCQVLIQPYNMSFEDGVSGYPAIGWNYSNKASQTGYSFYITDSLKYSGRKCLSIVSPLDSNKSTMATISQSVYAKPYLGKKVLLSAFLKANVEMPDNYAVLWINVRNSNGEIISNINSKDDPIFFDKWEKHSLELFIDSNASTINYGFALNGLGSMFVDNAEFSIIGAGESFNSPARNIDDSKLNYISSFASIYGIIRHFYPSEYHDKTDWARIAHLGVVLSEKSKNDDEFIKNMYTIFKPIAPLFAISQNENTKFDFQKPNSKPLKAISFLHKGIASDYTTAISNSKRINIRESQRDQAGLAIQASSLNISSYSNMDFELKVKARIDANNNWSFGNLLLRFENGKKEIIKTVSLKEPFINSKSMISYTITGVIPDEAASMRIAMNLYGEGKAYFDDVEMLVVDKDGAKSTLPIANSEFESVRTSLLPGWILPSASQDAGYNLEIVSEKGQINKELLISSDDNSKINLPNPENVYTENLPINYYARIATVLYADSTGVLPKSDGQIDFSASGKPDDFQINDNDRESRIAIIIDAWNYAKHFHSYSIDKDKLAQLLPELISKVAANESPDTLLLGTNKIFALLNDNQSRAWRNTSNETFTLPIFWKWIDGKLMVVNAKPGYNVFKGDVVKEINSIATDKYLSNMEASISGSNHIWKRLRSLAELRSGSENTELKLTIARKGEKDATVVLKRDTYPDDDKLIEGRPPRLAMLNDDIVYCDMTRTSDEEFKTYIPDLQKYKGIVFDARGVSNISEHLLGLLSDRELVPGKLNIDYFALPAQMMNSTKNLSSGIKKILKLQHLKVAFILDERSIGLSEVVLSIAKDNLVGKLIGRESSGNGGEISTVSLIGGYSFSQTVVKAVSPMNKLIYGTGIVPDIEIKQTLEESTGDSDPLIEKALEIIKQEIEKK